MKAAGFFCSERHGNSPHFEDKGSIKNQPAVKKYSLTLHKPDFAQPLYQLAVALYGDKNRFGAGMQVRYFGGRHVECGAHSLSEKI